MTPLLTAALWPHRARRALAPHTAHRAGRALAPHTAHRARRALAPHTAHRARQALAPHTAHRAGRALAPHTHTHTHTHSYSAVVTEADGPVVSLSALNIKEGDLVKVVVVCGGTRDEQMERGVKGGKRIRLFTLPTQKISSGVCLCIVHVNVWHFLSIKPK